MFGRIDDFLIDRVFQKIADAVHRVASCYAIGSFFLVGFAALHFGWWAFALTSGGPTPVWLLGLGFFLAMLWVPPRVMWAIRVERQWAEGREVLPPDRIRDIAMRLFFTFMLPIDGFGAYLDWLDNKPISMFGNLSWFLMVFGSYFLACTPKRPRKQTQTQLVWSGR